MRNLGRCILKVLAMALHQPGGAQVISFKHALLYVRALVDFNMMVQYRSPMSDTIAYMEDYLDQFQKLKDIVLEFRVTKGTQDKVDKQQKEIRHQKALVIEQVAPSLLHRMRDDNISKNNTLRSVRSVRLTHLTLERKSRTRTQPPYHTMCLTQPDAAPNPQDAPDAAPNPQNAPEAAPNLPNATRRQTSSSGYSAFSAHLPEISELERYPLYFS